MDALCICELVDGVALPGDMAEFVVTVEGWAGLADEATAVADTCVGPLVDWTVLIFDGAVSGATCAATAPATGTVPSTWLRSVQFVPI